MYNDLLTKSILFNNHTFSNFPMLYLTLAFLTFIANAPKNPYCDIDLNEEKLQAFIYAVKNHYWYQMYLDDLPVWGL